MRQGLRKGQAALEYIVTYGWGFLVILLVIGALAYFGLFSPSRYVPAHCNFGAQLECVDYQLLSADSGGPEIRMQLRNNLGDDVIIKNIQLADGSGSAFTFDTTAVIDQGNVSRMLKVAPDDGSVMPGGDRVSIPLTITFARVLGGPDHNITGTIFATVQ